MKTTTVGCIGRRATLSKRAAGRRFVWVDDEITDADRTWVAKYYSEPAEHLAEDQIQQARRHSTPSPNPTATSPLVNATSE